MQAKTEDDSSAVSELDNFTASQVSDSLSFLESMYAHNRLNASETTHQRALLIALSLDARIDTIMDEFKGFNMITDECCDGGFCCININDLKTEAKTIIAKICSHLPGKKLKKVILSMRLLQAATSNRLKYEAKESTLNWRTLRADLIQS